MAEAEREAITGASREDLADGDSRQRAHLAKALAVAVSALVIALMIEMRYSAPVEPSMVLRLDHLEAAPEPPAPAWIHPGGSVIRFAVAPVLSPAATTRGFTALAHYLRAYLDRPIQLIHGKSYAEINALVHQRQVAFALVCSGAYVLGRREFGMQALVVPVVRGRKVYHSYIVVPAHFPGTTWQDLRGGNFAFSDPLSNTGRLAPTYLLARHGFAPGAFFRSVTYTYSHDRSIEAVADGLVDGAAVDSLVYDRMVAADPTLGARTRIVWRSEPYGINPIVVASGVDPGLRRRAEGILLGLAGKVQGRKVLSELGVDRFEAPDPESYASIEKMMRYLGAL